MQFRLLQHYILAIMLGCALALSVIFGIIAHHMIKKQTLEESEALTRNLINAVNATASAAVFANNETLGRDAINGLITNDAIYSVTLIGYGDDYGSGMQLSEVSAGSSRGLTPITVPLRSLFDEQVMGELRVQPSEFWVERTANAAASKIIFILVSVVFTSCLITAHLIRTLISRPLVNLVKQLHDLKPEGHERLDIPSHLQHNEIGQLVSEFNQMLDRIQHAIQIERGLRHDMEVVQTNLERAKQEAEKATHAKSNFLATMSHEIRTPMNSILGFVELSLESPELNKSTRRHLQIAHGSAKYLLQLINDILDVSKIESGKLELEIRPFDLMALLTDIHDLMEIKAKQKRLLLSLSYPEDLTAQFLSDGYRLQQILINLVGNAIKFTDTGSVSLQVTRKGGNQLEFAIIDTGIGIAEDKIEFILQPFTQVDASISRKFGGTGLGTTISSELVQMLGGELKIESQLGEGSRFYFVIELEPIAGSNRPVAPVKTDVGKHQAQHILLVDDVVENISLARIRLENAGHKVTAATNGQEAVKMATYMPFDLILMDIQMPIMDGYEATRAIRALDVFDGHYQDAPIIALTANAMKEVQEKVLAAGMSEFVVKPIDFDELFGVINQFSDGSAPQQTPQLTVSSNQALLVDMKAGTKLWGGEAVYLQGIASFADRNQCLHTELSQLVVTDDWQGIHEMAHKVRGAAGNLKLNRLQQMAEQLETETMQAGQAPSPMLTEHFRQTLSDTLQQIAELVGDKQTDDSSSLTVAINEQDKPKVLEQLNALKSACELCDPDAAEQTLEQIGLLLGENTISQMDQYLQQFEFDKVVASAEKLSNELEQA